MYDMRMARVNVYLPDDLARQAKSAGLNVSRITQDALRSELAADRVDEWLNEVNSLESTGVGHDAAAAALSDAKDEIERYG